MYKCYNNYEYSCKSDDEEFNRLSDCYYACLYDGIEGITMEYSAYYEPNENSQ